MLNKMCCLCLKSIDDLLQKTTVFTEIKNQIEKVFRVELVNQPKDSIVCFSCCEKLQSSLELFQIIIDGQKLLQEQKFIPHCVKVEEKIVDIVPPDDDFSDKASSLPLKNVRSRNKTSAKSKKVEEQQMAEFYNFACTDCSITFPKFSLYKTHMQERHQNPLAEWICCGLRLNRRYRLMEHFRFHTNPSLFQCPECHKQLKDKAHMDRHRFQYHQPPESHQCDKCPKSFASIQGLKTHLLVHLSREDQKTFICDYCSATFKSKKLISQHMRKMHLKLCLFICDICARTFRSKNDFLYHYSSMHDAKPMPKVQCSICKTYLLNEKCLKSHIARIHKHGGPHVCTLCGKVSPSAQALRSHRIYMHQQERKFKCPHCEKAFKKQMNLKEHLTRHVGGALYACQFCDKTFNSNANMYSHRKRMHPFEHETMMQEKLLEKKPK